MITLFIILYEPRDHHTLWKIPDPKPGCTDDQKNEWTAGR